MKLTFLGIFVIGLLFFVCVFARKWNPIKHPYLILFLLYFKNFGYHLDTVYISQKTEIVLFVSFCVFFISFYFTYAKKNSFQFIRRHCNNLIRRTGIESLPNRALRRIFWVIMLYCIINLIVNTYIFGGFEKALVRFYYLMPEYEVPYFFLYALNLFFFLTSFLLVVLSINYSIFKRGYIWLFLSFIALTFTMFSSGTRGYLINTTLFIIIGVLAGGIYSKHKVIRTLLSFKILFFVIISLLSSALLTNIRTNEYESISDVIDEIGAENIYIDESKGGIGEGVLEQTDMVINTFGSQYEYLHPFYTIASIVVNPIPRMFWKDKPVGVGLIMSEASLGYSNFDPKYLAEEYDISFAMGVAGEGWMQGGWISMIYLSSFFGLLAGFWANMTKFCFQKKNYFYAIVGLMTLNALMLLNRGDMLSAFTQGTYPILFFFIIAFILNPLLKRR